MEETERDAAIERIREYVSQQQRADRSADRGSLDRAADLEALYQDMSWAEEIEPPKNKIWRGRPVDPCSRNRFASWVLTTTGLSPSHVRNLHLATETLGIIASTAAVNPNGERALRPLRGLIRKGYADSMPLVYNRAVELAGGEAPTGAQVTQAKREFLAKFTRTQIAHATQEQRIAQYRKKILDMYLTLKYFDEAAAKQVLDDLSNL